MGSLSSRDRRDPELSAILDEETLDESMHYRFFQSRPSRIARARALGYKVVDREEDGVRTLFDQDEDDGTGAIIHGDRVLMQLPKTHYEKEERRKIKLANDRLAGPDSKFREMAERSGIRVAEAGLGREPKDEE